MRIRAYRYRLYPTPSQANTLKQTMGACRWLWNYALAKKKEAWEKEETLNINDIASGLKGMKKQPETEWLSQAVSSSLIWALRTLDVAYKNYFRQLKDGTIKKARLSYISDCRQRGIEPKNSKLATMGHPRFKKRGHRQTMKFHQGYVLDYEKGVIHMPKCPNVKAVYHRPLLGTPKSVTVELTAAGHYYMAIVAQEPVKVPAPKKVKARTTVGLHNGITHFVTSDSGLVIAKTNRHLRNSLARMQVLQRRFSRKQEGSGRWHRQRRQIAALHEKITAQRNYLLHQVSAAIIANPKYQTICVENWDKREMMRNPIFAQAIADVSWGRLINFIKYKAEWAGKQVLELEPGTPNAITCSHCGHVNEWVELRHRQWNCKKCNTRHKREENCAKNTRQMCLEQVL